MDKRTKFIGISVFALIFAFSMGLTYAYLNVVVAGNEKAKAVRVGFSAGLRYTDEDFVTYRDIGPRWFATKTVTVKNESQDIKYYDLVWGELDNTVEYGQLVMSLDCSTRNGTCDEADINVISNPNPFDYDEDDLDEYFNSTQGFKYNEDPGAVIPTNNPLNTPQEDIPIVGGIEINPGETHTYNIVIYFKDMNRSQMKNSDRHFYGVINIKESTDAANILVYAGREYTGGVATISTEPPRTYNVDNKGRILLTRIPEDDYTLTLYGKDSTEGEETDFTLEYGEEQSYEGGVITTSINNEVSIVLSEEELLKPIAGTLAQDWQVKAGYRTPYYYSTTTTDKGLKVQSITFYDDGRTFNGITPTDVSSNNDGSILLYQEETTECTPVNTGTDSSPVWTTPSTCYNDYIVANGRIDFPVGSKELFYRLENVNTINFNNSVNTSNVTDMSSMFERAGYSAQTFDIEKLSNWDTSSVTNMESMFYNAGYNATTFDIGNLSNWDTSNVTNMSEMFWRSGIKATIFELDLSNWDTSNVTNMKLMFAWAGQNATTWNIGDISDWNVSSVTDMSSMFAGTDYNATPYDIGDISNWNTSKVTNMQGMFNGFGRNAQSFKLDLSNWDTSNVTDMSNMFFGFVENAQSFELDLSNWDTSKVTNMSQMFHSIGTEAQIFKLDLSNWNTSSVTSMYGMFRSAGENSSTFNIGNISNWNTSSVVEMTYMFDSAGKNASYSLDLSGWNVSLVTEHSNFNSSVTSKVIPPVWVH